MSWNQIIRANRENLGIIFRIKDISKPLKQQIQYRDEWCSTGRFHISRDRYSNVQKNQKYR
jgi:hypothetical protein